MMLGILLLIILLGVLSICAARKSERKHTYLEEIA